MRPSWRKCRHAAAAASGHPGGRTEPDVQADALIPAGFVAARLDVRVLVMPTLYERPLRFAGGSVISAVAESQEKPGRLSGNLPTKSGLMAFLHAPAPSWPGLSGPPVRVMVLIARTSRPLGVPYQPAERMTPDTVTVMTGHRAGHLVRHMRREMTGSVAGHECVVNVVPAPIVKRPACPEPPATDPWPGDRTGSPERRPRPGTPHSVRPRPWPARTRRHRPPPWRPSPRR